MRRHQRNGNRRIIALDVRAQKCGYALFETPARLLDFGLAWFETPRAAARRLDFLLRATHPAILVLRRRRRTSRECPRMTAALHAICRAARLAVVTVTKIGDPEMEHYFAKQGAHNKDERASVVASSFPQLASRLPPRRRLWQSENWYMTTFDAVAVGVAYLASSDMQESP